MKSKPKLKIAVEKTALPGRVWDYTLTHPETGKRVFVRSLSKTAYVVSNDPVFADCLKAADGGHTFRRNTAFRRARALLSL